MSADPHMLPFLLGTGLKQFSIDIVNAPTVQRLVEAISFEDAQKITQTMLGFGRISEVEEFLATLDLKTPVSA